VSLHGEDPIPAALAARGVPFVFVGLPPQVAAVSYVDVDNRQGGRRATRHLLELGRTCVATIAGPVDMAPGIDRLDGYRDALRAAGPAANAEMVEHGDFTQEGGAAAMERLLAAHPDIDGVFCASDLMAAGALGVLVARGVRVPEDMAIVGYDDSPIAAAMQPPLTSVRQPIEEMGPEAVHLLLDAIERADRPPRRVVLATELVPRASSVGREAS
jgi:DNA-binding LacI/PurR family transcriptional regulator